MNEKTTTNKDNNFKSKIKIITDSNKDNQTIHTVYHKRFPLSVSTNLKEANIFLKMARYFETYFNIKK